MRLGGEADNYLGNKSITALGNNNYVIASEYSTNEEGFISALLVDGNTGVQIGVTLKAEVRIDDDFGYSGITALDNSNYVFASSFDKNGGIANAGSVRLVDGSTGMQIGTTLRGDLVDDRLGQSSITALNNNNYVVASAYDDENDTRNAGSVRLMNGSTGEQISATLAGDTDDDFFGSDGITPLGNNNYVIASSGDNEGGNVGAGSVWLVNGNTGVQVGAALKGDKMNDRLGRNGVTALNNNNYVIASSLDEEDGISSAGSVRLVNGSTGVQIGATLRGNLTGDQLGFSSTTALGNNNYVIASESDDEGGIVDAGTVRLVSGDTGEQIGATLSGDESSDLLGRGSVTALDNNNYVIASNFDDEDGIEDAGSVRLMNGNTGVQIGATQRGNVVSDRLGYLGIRLLENNNYVILSSLDDKNGIADAGSVRLMNGTTGVPLASAIAGEFTNDMRKVQVIKPIAGDYYILSQPYADRDGQENAGRVRIVAP